jgi:dipeptide transport system ATP-binding protein
MPLLEIRNLSVDFATASGAFRAVDGTDVSVDAGELLAIVGESGSGKSVSMLALMGLLPWTATITSDVMTFDGQDLRGISPRDRRRIVGKDMAMIFQEPMSSLNPCFTAGYQIKEALRIHLGMGRSERHARAIELFEMVGIPAPEQRLGAFPHQLSGGMCQRVMIAMAIACKPKLLIADEPTTALDVTIQAQILDLLTGLQRDTGMALILITHDMGVVAETAERVSVQYAGQKVEEQGVIDLFATPHHPYTAALLAALPERPTGCLFSPRCSFADDICRAVPPIQAGADLGLARCHYPLKATA